MPRPVFERLLSGVVQQDAISERARVLIPLVE